ncbi:FKBP-type peptidyl-prolyl cis-trans isomerase [Microbacterium betulae]|uniref:peptidylprolyl isomerase n=1 Tax=Microbacterium betulae TaxID=2981139 RepID=A0AA97FJM3_9MICO|nr:FKBP-type peptidyl-prolyl cis-trans isomerase [Microbacterium sp. AB]WOF24488.1 FKBP-type peptidyl-prolyl cis-trans isomerase [Microbacterium sp. AB]
MRKTPAILSAAALTMLALAGCSPVAGGEASCDRAAGADASLTDLIDVTGSLDAAPTVDMFAPFHVDENAYADVEVGDGPVITSLDQSGVLDMTLYDGNTGEVVIGTSYSGDLSAVGVLSQWSTQFPGLDDALRCATEGSRVIAALDDDGVSAEAREYYAQAGFPQEGSIVAVVDVRKVYPAAASGTLQYNDGFGLPSVVRDTDGRPGVVVPDAPAPDELVVQTLIKGDGAELTIDDTPLVQYTGVLWDEKTVFDSSWESGSPVPFTLDGGVIEGFTEGLVGQTIGSQVMIVVPPELGYGDEGQGSVPAGATLVFVVDILGVQDAPAQ